jgi:hypothetical protein
VHRASDVRQIEIHVAELLPSAECWCLDQLILNPEDGCDRFLPNIGSHMDCYMPEDGNIHYFSIIEEYHGYQLHTKLYSLSFFLFILTWCNLFEQL